MAGKIVQLSKPASNADLIGLPAHRQPSHASLPCVTGAGAMFETTLHGPEFALALWAKFIHLEFFNTCAVNVKLVYDALQFHSRIPVWISGFHVKIPLNFF